LLQELEKAIARDGIPEPPRLEVGTSERRFPGKKTGGFVWCFHAQSPLCCPKRP
jgi:hypothetical protein